MMKKIVAVDNNYQTFFITNFDINLFLWKRSIPFLLVFFVNVSSFYSKSYPIEDNNTNTISQSSLKVMGDAIVFSADTPLQKKEPKILEAKSSFTKKRNVIKSFKITKNILKVKKYKNRKPFKNITSRNNFQDLELSINYKFAVLTFNHNYIYKGVYFYKYENSHNVTENIKNNFYTIHSKIIKANFLYNFCRPPPYTTLLFEIIKINLNI